MTFAFIVLVVVSNWSALGPAGIAFGAGLILLLFGCVRLHEFGHALATQHYGIPVREIVLLPIGGIAVLGRSTRSAMQELVIAAAGPAVNVGGKRALNADLLRGGVIRVGNPVKLVRW